MEIKWLIPTQTQWAEYLKRSANANWMQSWHYARAVHARDYKAIRFAEIIDSGKVIGVFMTQEIKLGPIHFFELNRGPLWFDQQLKTKHFAEFVKVLAQEVPPRWLGRRRWLPELVESSDSVRIFLENNYKKTKASFSTVFIDLKKDLETLKKEMDPKWRNGLSKAERSSLKISIDQKGQELNLFLTSYQKHLKDKKYLGPSPAFIQHEMQSALMAKEALIIWAFDQSVDVPSVSKDNSSQVIAGIFIHLHGKNASYRIGWSSDLGRKQNAHYLMLWNAVEYLKQAGYSTFDLGGLLPDEAPGLTKFKLGMGGEEIKLLGLFK